MCLRAKDETAIIVEEPLTYNGIAIVCFLDLLGFSDAIKKDWENENYSLRNNILALKKDIQNPPPRKYVGLFDGKEIQLIPHVMFVSDSIIISFSNHSDCINIPQWIFISALLNTIKTIWRKVIECGFTLRGGIEVGPVFWNDRDILGPAYVMATDLEKKADCSRIVCGKSFVEYMRESEENSNTHYNRFFLCDKDKQFCFNPSDIWKDGEAENPKTIIEMLEQLQKQAEGKESFHPQKTIRPAEKYDELINILKNPDVVSPPTIDDVNNFLCCDNIRKQCMP